MKFAFTTLTLASSSPVLDDDVVMLSVARESAGVEAGMSSLIDFARAESPIKAAGLLQEFAASTLARGEAVDDKTKSKLKEIGAQLTNNTWMALEQAHRRDQDRINMNWRAIKECGDKHIAHLQQDVDSFEVIQVRTFEKNMISCRGLPDHENPLASLLQGPVARDIFKNTKFELSADGERYWGQVSKEYEKGGSRETPLLDLKNHACKVCGDLDAFLEGLEKSKPSCGVPMTEGTTKPQATTRATSVINSDLGQYFRNLEVFANNSLTQWRALDKACKDARAAYKEHDEHCDQEQAAYETAFCSYRQGLHSTCAEYQGCHIMTEEQYRKLIKDVLYAADSRKIDWKAIHKIACYIKVLISDGTNEERTEALENCESGDLNTLASILTGFNESNYLSVIIPEISQNVSCWDLEVPPLIDFKECDMSSVEQYPCTETWEKRYEGLESPATCTACAQLPAHMQYSAVQETNHAQLDEYGGGWIFVNTADRSEQDMDDLMEITPGSYLLPEYNMKGLRWNEVLVQRVSANWCDSWGRQSSKWVEQDGASMCVQSDNDHVYCMNNHKSDPHKKHHGHGPDPRWRQQPVSHFGAICGKEGDGECECWPHEGEQTLKKLKEGELEGKLCFAHEKDAKGAIAKNVPAPKTVTIHSLEEDGSVVKVSFRGEEKVGKLRVGNYGSFLDGVGCGAVTPVKYRVFVRCLGCTTQRSDFHTKDGAQFNSVMQMGHTKQESRSRYTYEAWFKSPLDGNFRRELFGGALTGLTLTLADAGAPDCLEFSNTHNEQSLYRVTAGGAGSMSSYCFQKNLFYHVAITKCEKNGVKVYVNGRDVTLKTDDAATSSLQPSFGGGFTDGGQLFNVRIWNYARSPVDLLQDAFKTDIELLSSKDGLAHWWPLTDNVMDIITNSPLKGQKEVRYSPIWCSDLEATGMRGC